MRLTCEAVVGTMFSSLLVLLVVSLLSVGTNGSDRSDLMVWFPKIPADYVIAGNLISDEKWYALNADEIRCVKSILAGRAAVFLGVPRRQPHSLILWASEDGHLVAIDVILLSNFVNGKALAYSENRALSYVIEDSKGFKPLAELIDRVHEGKELPLNSGVRGVPGTRKLRQFRGVLGTEK
jgi:hypothetical protein